MLVAEDLMLLVTDDQTGKHAVGEPGLGLGLASACLVELALQGKIDIGGPADVVKPGRLVVRDASSSGDQILDEALRRLAEREGSKPAQVLQAVAKNLRRDLLERLSAAGILRHDEGRVLGIFPVHRWPAVDSAHEQEVHRLLRDVLVRGTTPDPRTASLISLLSAMDAAHRVVDGSPDGVDKRMIKKRAKALREGDWAAGAVASAISAVQAAVAGAVTASVVASTTASSG